jgi:hypothetical protein
VPAATSSVATLRPSRPAPPVTMMRIGVLSDNARVEGFDAETEKPVSQWNPI